MRRVIFVGLMGLTVGCGPTPVTNGETGVVVDTGAADTASSEDTSVPTDTSTSNDTSASNDTSTVSDSADTSVPTDTGSPAPEQILTGDSCFGAPTVVSGAYTGTLSYNLNEFSSTPSCANVPVAGRDGVVIVEVPVGQRLDLSYTTRGGDAVLFLLDSCPVLTSCLAASDASSGDSESLQWTNNGTETNRVYVVMDHAEMDQGMRFDLQVTLQ